MPLYGLVLLIAGLIASLSGAGAADSAKAPQNVVVAPVVRRNVSPSQEYVGRVQAINTVNLQARVEGFLEQRKFTEGAMVKKGELLFVLEQAPYKAAVTQSQASVEKTQAGLKNDELNLGRQKTLVGEGDVAETTLDSATATAASSKAQVKDAEAALDISKINLGYTEIHSPIDGRIGTSKVDVGNLVGPSSGTLATVVSLDPVYVTLNPSASRILEQRQKGIVKGNKVDLVPRLKLSNGSMYGHPGKFDFVDTSVQQGTDTVLLRAAFPNPDALLTPGQYLTVIVAPENPVHGLVVPQKAVQLDKSGHYVLVVAGNKVAKKAIKLGGMSGVDWIVAEGLREGDRVIVAGQQKVSPGDTVAIAKSGS